MQFLSWLSVAVLVPILAVALPATTTTPAITSNNHAVSPTTFAWLEELARLVDISYCVGSTGIQKPFKCLSRCSDFDGVELITTWNTGPLLSDSCGYIAISHAPLKKRVIVAFRGTYSLANTIADLSAAPAEYEPFPWDGDEDDSVCAAAKTTVTVTQPPLLQTQPKRSGQGGDADRHPKLAKCFNCTVHSGFMGSWRNTRCTVLPHVEKALRENSGYELTLVGHSLGGAVAVLAALEFQARGWKPRVTTFGEPRVGNKAFNAFVNQRFNLVDHDDEHYDDNVDRFLYHRVTHINDPVPLLPPQEWGYTMHAGEVYISKSGLPPKVEDLQYCSGNQDPQCIAATRTTVKDSPLEKEPDLDADSDSLGPDLDLGFGIGQRFRLWQLLFAHRDYFWRLGLCVPGGDPWHWNRVHYEDGTTEYGDL